MAKLAVLFGVVAVLLAIFVICLGANNVLLSAQLADVQVTLASTQETLVKCQQSSAEQREESTEWYQKYIKLLEIAPCQILRLNDGTGNVVVVKGLESGVFPLDAEGVEGCQIFMPK